MTSSENPAKNITQLDPDLSAILREACSQAGLSGDGARLIHHYANAVCLLPAENAVARITRAGRVERATTAVAVTRWLTDVHGYPATAPLPERDPVVLDDSTVVTFWVYYPQPGGNSPDSTHLGQLVRRLHDLPEPPIELAHWRPLHGLHAMVADPARSPGLPPADRAWLLPRIEQVQQDLSVLDWPLGWGHIHGDAWAGNLMWNTASPGAPCGSRGQQRPPVLGDRPQAVLGDFDAFCYGPREVDLIPSWHAAVRYGRGQAWARDFMVAYGYDLAAWSGFPTLFAMRDLVQLAGPMRRSAHDGRFAAALRQRLDGIRHNDRNTWREF